MFMVNFSNTAEFGSQTGQPLRVWKSVCNKHAKACLSGKHRTMPVMEFSQNRVPPVVYRGLDGTAGRISAMPFSAKGLALTG
jgi:hypothetical protein